MKAVGKNLIIKIQEEASTKTKGGLLLAEIHREDIRYRKAEVLNVGDEVVGINNGDKIYFDRRAGHGIEIDKEKFHVIKLQDVVVIL
jgi:co-chaperonin GroES (HSP10)